MTTSLQTDPRRAARDAVRKPPRRPLEMPVLFQLADLSLPRAKSAPSSAPPAAVVEPVTTPVLPEIIVPVVAPPAAPSSAIAEPAVIEPLKAESPKSPKREIPQVETLPLESPRAMISQVEPQLSPVAPTVVAEETKIAPLVAEESKSAPDIADSASTKGVAESIPNITAAATSSATDTTPPSEPTALSPRERAEQRAKNRQPVPASNDWMRTHGKFIAVGFVIALIVTIYMAQNGDEPAPANPAAAAARAKAEAKAPPAENEAESKITDAHTAKESVATAGHDHSPGLLKEASPAEEHSPAEARAELPVPTTRDTAKEPAGESDVADSKSLFPWKEPAEARVASKPNDGRSNVQFNPHVTEPKTKAKEEVPAAGPPAAEPPVEETPAEEAPSVYGPPSSQRQVPAATQPASLGQ
ncbi:MAG: hypothetical protein K8R36_20640, partial [Planctomycetales bacterium]|nr:hypothetical protein [Planctomycetales bacterium]